MKSKLQGRSEETSELFHPPLRDALKKLWIHTALKRSFKEAEEEILKWTI